MKYDIIIEFANGRFSNEEENLFPGNFCRFKEHIRFVSFFFFSPYTVFSLSGIPGSWISPKEERREKKKRIKKFLRALLYFFPVEKNRFTNCSLRPLYRKNISGETFSESEKNI